MSDTESTLAVDGEAPVEAPPPAPVVFHVRAGDRLRVTYVDGSTGYVEHAPAGAHTAASLLAAPAVNAALRAVVVAVALPDGRVLDVAAP